MRTIWFIPTAFLVNLGFVLSACGPAVATATSAPDVPESAESLAATEAPSTELVGELSIIA